MSLLLQVFNVIYRIFILIGSVVAFPVCLLHPRGKKDVSQRYGAWDLTADGVIWFHGPSVGEINGLLPLIRKFKTLDPEAPILVTATSITGLVRVEKEADFVRLLPFDDPIFLKRALKNVTVKAFIFGETEIWPALISELSRRDVPMFLVNGRISDFSIKHYKLVGGVIKEALNKLTLIFSSDEISSKRFIEVGADPSIVLQAGNTKYDTKPSVESEGEARELKKRFFGGSEAQVLVLGSLRPGEETGWLEAVKNCGQEQKELNVILAPRHQEKFDFFLKRLEDYAFQFVSWSDCKASGKIPEFSEKELIRIILLDTMGDLASTYSFADLTFIGGSLVEGVGGHNPLEAAAYKSAVSMGPYYQNVAEIVEDLKNDKAITIIRTHQDSSLEVERIFDDALELKAQGERAYKIWKAYAGATERIIDRIEKNLGGTAHVS